MRAGVNLGAAARPTRGASAGTTRTPTSASRRCSRLPTGSAARRRARWPRAWPPRRCVDDPWNGGRRRARPGRLAGSGSQPPRPTSAQADDDAVSGMGTTIYRRPWVEGDHVWIAHVGDSRAYRIRDRHRAADRGPHPGRGAHPPRKALARPGRGAIRSCRHPRLGPDPAVEVDTTRSRPRPGDLFLLCSDGLTTMVDGEDHPARVSRATATTCTPPRRRWCARPIWRRRRGQHHGGLLRDRGRRRPRRAHASPLPPQQQGTAEDSDDADTLDEVDRVPVVAAFLRARAPASRRSHPVRRRALLERRGPDRGPRPRLRLRGLGSLVLALRRRRAGRPRHRLPGPPLEHRGQPSPLPRRST